MNSSDDDEIIEVESSTDNESNLSTENQSDAEMDLLNITKDTSENEAKNQRKKPLKGKRRPKMLPWEEVQLHQNIQSTLEKNSRNKNNKTRKKTTEI